MNHLEAAELTAQLNKLPGLRIALESTVRAMNEISKACGLPAVSIEYRPEAIPARRGRPPEKASSNETVLERKRNRQAEKEALEQSNAGSKISAKGKRSIGSASAERWAIAREAGIDTGGKIPNKEMVMRARKILADRARRAELKQQKATPAKPRTATAGA